MRKLGKFLAELATGEAGETHLDTRSPGGAGAAKAGQEMIAAWKRVSWRLRKKAWEKWQPASLPLPAYSEQINHSRRTRAQINSVRQTSYDRFFPGPVYQ